MVERVAGNDPGERSFREDKRLGVADGPSQVGEPKRSLLRLGLLDHGPGQVDARNIPDHLGDLASDQPGTAGNIEHLVFGSYIRRVDPEPVNPRVVAGVHLRERSRLPGELVQDQLSLLVHGNLQGYSGSDSGTSQWVRLRSCYAAPTYRDRGRTRAGPAETRQDQKARGEFTKHLLRFRHDSMVEGSGDEIPELILVNSHDGTSSYQLMAGICRTICAHGLIV